MFDSHAHIMFSAFWEERPLIIARARAAGLRGWLEVGTDVATSQRALFLAQKEAGVWATAGVHPSDVAGLSEADWQAIELLLNEEKVVAVGEVGLDYYHLPTGQAGLPEKDVPQFLQQQQTALERFVMLAHQHELPIVFHVRDGQAGSAHETLLMYLEKLPARDRPRGVIHTFSGTMAQAERYVALGLYLSFSGVVTFKNAGDIARAAAWVPADRFLLETDSPFLAPEPFRGKRNEPAYVKYIAQCVAGLRGASFDDIAEGSWHNAQALFQLTA